MNHIFTMTRQGTEGTAQGDYPHTLTIRATSILSVMEIVNGLTRDALSQGGASDATPVTVNIAGVFTGEESFIARLAAALQLLARATKAFEHQEPDKNWFLDYFRLTGEHMVLTEEGWISGVDYERIDGHPPQILAEVNNPEGIDRSFGRWRADFIRRARQGGKLEMFENVYTIAEVGTEGLRLKLGRKDQGRFTYETLKEHGAVLRDK